MKEIVDKVGGLDVHRDTVVACSRVRERDGTVTFTKETFSTTRKGLESLAQFLTDAGVSTVVMEATGVYWKPVYYALEGLFPQLWLCNAQYVKNVPGRKTDLADAEWLADVAAHGMVRPSFVPPPEIRELRELTRYRKTQVDARAREIQRLEKVLQDAGIKLTSVASAVWSASSREIIEALIAGERSRSSGPDGQVQDASQDPSTRGGTLWTLRSPPCLRRRPDHRPYRLSGLGYRCAY